LCSCLNEEVSCQKRPCPVQCSHPVRSESCCPVCDSCLFEGGVHPHGATFTPSDTCQRCTCIRGSVSCTSLVCPKPACSKPLTKPGQCCPECPVCVSEQQEYRDGQTWTPSSKPLCPGSAAPCVQVKAYSHTLDSIRH
uniref:VWFC domain-containing protein n=1 Tax=Neogobius melanostomus TaxID=47308 RepID=A0A8C6SP01_9GOBI